MTAPKAAMTSAMAPSFASQCLGEFLRRLGRIDPHPAVLDLGVLCGGNIAFLGARGCRVSVESLPSASKAAGPAASPVPVPVKGVAEPAGRAPVSPLSYPPESFSGVLAWDAISRMNSQEAVAFVETLRRLLLEGGVILAHFPGPPGAAGWAGRYRILG
jgi:hypothetical protein